MQWLLLSYRLPREPSRLRLAAWRRLRRVGAILLHEAVWTLPSDAKTREHLEWLAEEIEEHGGTVFLWQAESLAVSEERLIVDRFRSEAEARYLAIADSANAIHRAVMKRRRAGSDKLLAHALRQLRGLERALRLERRRDYFRVEARREAEAVVHDAVATVAQRASSAAPRRHSHALDHATALSR